jgi:hypothetical protein
MITFRLARRIDSLYGFIPRAAFAFSKYLFHCLFLSHFHEWSIALDEGAYSVMGWKSLLARMTITTYD